MERQPTSVLAVPCTTPLSYRAHSRARYLPLPLVEAGRRLWFIHRHVGDFARIEPPVHVFVAQDGLNVGSGRLFSGPTCFGARIDQLWIRIY